MTGTERSAAEPGGLTLFELTFLDVLAFGLFWAGWIGYTLFADHSRWRRRSITNLMNQYREQWMQQMLHRDNRIVDTNILGNLQNGAAFFASTTIFALGGLIAILGASDQAIAVLSAFPFVEPGTAHTWQLKVLLLILVLSYAFFKFAWTFRLQNYCSVLLGATPVAVMPGNEGEAMAFRAAKMSSLAARHFNRGLRAYFFALAALAWFLHPALFICTILYVVYVLQRREFRSKSFKVLQS